MKTLSLSHYTLACTAIALLAGCGGGSATVGAVPMMPASYDALTHHKTFRYTGNRQSFIVPEGVKRLTIVARGGMGAASDSSGGGGRVGRVSAIIPVTPGEQLFVFVGGPGSKQAGGFNGGGNGGTGSYCECTGFGGGGASDVRQGGYKVADRILVAGGGGGDGANGDETADLGGTGGPGGGTIAGRGSAGSGDSPGGGGGGGTQESGGAGGKGGSSYGNGIAGSLGAAGDGGGGYSSYGTGGGGGGGGGGYYGGGGGGAGDNSYSSGGDPEAGGGGGGGSSYIERDAIGYRFWRGWKGDTPTGLVVFSWGG